MQLFLRLIRPATLKYKLFFAFLLIILLPFALMQFYHFHKMESLIEKQLSKQSQEQIAYMKESIGTVKEAVFKTLYIFEGDPQVTEVLQRPDEFEENERKLIMEDKLRYIKESFLPSNIQVYFTIADLKGSAYSSFIQNEFDYSSLASQQWFADTLESASLYRWEMEEPSDNAAGKPGGSAMLTLYAPLKGQQSKAYGVLRIGIDYYEWMKSISRDFPLKQEYYILNHEGAVLSETSQGGRLSQSALDSMITAVRQGGEGIMERRGSSLIHANFIPSLQWILVSRFHLELFIGDIEEMKRNFIMTLALVTAVFILFTLLLSVQITRPLNLLQMKMSKVVSSNLKTQLSETNQSGELLAVAQSFNQMVADLNQLVERLKMEERQKEALRFQMLLSQMNPHFLLNTLNTIKLIVLLKEEENVPAICEALGKLLETGLNTEMDLLHLKDELALVNAYLYIQQLRFKGPFEVAYEIKDELQYALVPKFSLQPLVENAIVHGFSELKHQGKITVRAEMTGGNLVVEVEDNGVGLERASIQRTSIRRNGIALHNLKERLRLLYKEEADFELLSLAQGTLARMTVPLLLSEPYHSEEHAHGGGSGSFTSRRS